jgi:Transglycosylase SLT domain
MCYLPHVPREQDFEGLRVPGSRERVSLLAAVAEYISAWQRATESELKPSEARVHELNQRAAELQQRSVRAGFGGLAHHVAEYTRLLATGGELSRLRGQLSIVSELASQARQALSPEEKAHLAAAVPPGPAANGAPFGGAAGLAPPPLITVMRHADGGPAAALRSAQEEGGAPRRPDALPVRPGPPPAWAAAPVAPVSLPERPPSPAAQFSVKNMLGLRAFNRGRPPDGGKVDPVNAGPLLALPRLGAPVAGTPRPSTPPPLLRSDISGLPPLAVDDRYTGSARKSGQIERRMSPLPAVSRPGRSPPWPRATPGRPELARQLRARSQPGQVGLWVGIAGALVFLGIGLTAFVVFGRRPRRADPEISSSSAATAADSGAALPSAKPGVAMPPRERLLADDERFMSLLAQVHGHGGTESPELRSLLNDQAALASKALSGKCNDGSPTCKAWSDVRDLIVGDRKSAIVKRRRGSEVETTRSGWMAGLKMPGVPVEDDPRVLRVFEYYTENPVGRETFQSMLFRCGAYRDLIQSTLIRYDLPPELLALVFTESGCEPSAKSPVGAAGLWQFMPDTGRAYHLNIVEGAIDERYSPFKSTEAGIRMLADLRLKLGSWDLVFASYNLGPFGVLARLEKAGADASFWDLVDADLLPDETANYAPTVDALALILANLQRLKFAGVQIRAPQLTADLEVAGGTRLSLVARAAATSVAQLRSLNLDFSGDLVPVIPGGSIAVQVPKDVVWQARDAIKELLSSKDGADQCVPSTFDWGKQRFTPEMSQACQKRLSSAARDSP